MKNEFQAGVSTGITIHKLNMVLQKKNRKINRLREIIKHQKKEIAAMKPAHLPGSFYEGREGDDFCCNNKDYGYLDQVVECMKENMGQLGDTGRNLTFRDGKFFGTIVQDMDELTDDK